LVVALAADCEGQDDQSKHARTSDALGSAGGSQKLAPVTPGQADGSTVDPDAAVRGPDGSIVHPGMVYPSSVTDEEMRHIAECMDLQEAAFNASGSPFQHVQVDQCSTDSDCVATFNPHVDGCWDTCSTISIYVGTSEYGQALKDIAKELCSQFHSKGCDVAANSCRPQADAIMWACESHKCVKQ
jgi:hypothetical protein